MQRSVCLHAIAVIVFLLLLPPAAVHAIDNPDAPDYIAAFDQRAAPFRSALDAAADAVASAAASASYGKFLEAELDRAYRQLLGRLDDVARRDLQASEQAWDSWYKAEVAFIYSNWTPANFGSSSVLSRAQYRTSIIEARIRQLLGYLMNYPPDGSASPPSSR